MILQQHFTLPNGVEIPQIGLGTWMIPNDAVGQAVLDAVDIGYRHVDTAQAYGNEAGVGDGVRACGVARDELFITTKLAAEVKSYDEAVRAIDESLAKLGLDHIDLMLIHSPWPWRRFGDADRFAEGNREAWRALEAAYQAGKLRAIGVSNFERVDLDNLFDACSVEPMVNQILAHISNTPFELIEDSRSRGMLVQAYSPIAHGELMKNQRVTAMAERYGVSVPQLGIRYCLQLGMLPLPKTAKPAHMKNNADVEFVISDEDMAELQGLPQIDNYGEASAMPVFGGRLGQAEKG